MVSPRCPAAQADRRIRCVCRDVEGSVAVRRRCILGDQVGDQSSRPRPGARSVAGGMGLGQGSSRPPNKTSCSAGSFQSASDGLGTTHPPSGQAWRLWFRVIGYFALDVAPVAVTQTERNDCRYHLTNTHGPRTETPSRSQSMPRSTLSSDYVAGCHIKRGITARESDTGCAARSRA
jgi:hypothetical protein